MNNFSEITSSPFGLLALIGLCFLVILGVIVITLLIKWSTKFTILTKTSSALSSTIDAHKEVVQELPALVGAKVSSQVECGLRPFSQELQTLNGRTITSLKELQSKLGQDHHLFSQALLTLNSQGDLSEWVNKFREVIEPLQKTSTSLEQHYQTSQGILRTVQSVVVEFSGIRKSAESSFERITTVVEHWEASQSTHMRDIENRILSRLEEVADIQDKVANGLSEQQVATAKLSASNDELCRSVKQVNEVVGGMRDLNLKIDDNYRQSFNQISQKSDEMVVQVSNLRQQADHWLKRVAGAVERWEKDENTHMRTIESRVMERLKEVANTHKQIGEELTALQHASNKVLEGQSQMQKSTEHVVKAIEQMQQIAKVIKNEYQEILSTQKDFQGQMHQQQHVFQSQIQSLLTNLDNSINTVAKQGELLCRQLAQQSQAVFSQAQTILNSFNEGMQALQAEHTKSLVAFHQGFERSLNLQQDLANQQSKLMDDARALMYRLPTKSMQVAFLILFITHLVFTGVLAYDILKPLL